MKTKEKNIFDVITEYSVNEGLDKIYLEAEEYKDIQNRMDQLTEQLDTQGFTTRILTISILRSAAVI